MRGDATILVVEDEEDLADEYANTLSEKYEVLIAYSGEEALEKVDSTVSVILLDRRMPGISGDEVLDRISKEELGCRVVMVTAVEPSLDIVEMDFDEYLVKPVSRQTIIDVVDQMVLRNTYDERIQEMFAIAAKLATLEAKLDIQQLNQSEQYSRLRSQFEELKQDIDTAHADEDLYLDATREKLEALLKESI